MSTTEVSQNILSGFSIYAISSFRSIENKHDVYRGKDYEEDLWILKRLCNEKN